ncbi:MAG: tetratricopeptide repeat protein [Polyangia bacterium]
MHKNPTRRRPSLRIAGLLLLLVATPASAGQPAMAPVPPGVPARPQPPEPEGAETWQRSYEREAAGQLAEALAALDALPQARKGEYLALARRGWLLYRLGRSDTAVDAYQRAVAAAPQAVEARVGLLLPLSALRRWNELAAAAKEVLSLEPRNYYGTLRLAFAHYNLGHFADAGTLYAQLKQGYPSDLEVRSGLGWSLLKQGKTADAAREFRELLSVSPRHALGRQGLDAALARHDPAAR